MKQEAVAVYSVDLDRFKHELVRKCLHMMIAFLPLITAYSFLLAYVLLGTGILVYTFSEYIRLKYCSRGLCTHWATRIINRTTEFAARGHEQDHFIASPLTLAAGALLTISFFPETPMKIGIFALAFGDTAAALVGRLFPLHSVPGLKGKSVGGVLGCLTVSIGTIWLVSNDLTVALVCGVTATLVELMPLRAYDNVCIPVVVASVAMLLIQ